MNKFLCISILALLTFKVALFGQGITVTGTVTSSEDGSPLPGVNILVQGTTTGVNTDINGKYSISVPNVDATLVFSFVGLLTETIKVGNQTQINVTLAQDITGLQEVVVTALGIEKKAKSLAYSTQQVSSDEITKVKDVSLINSLSGKVAGVEISKSSSGLGGSSRVIIRGSRSLNGNNQPLYVIDGIPMLSSSIEQPATTFGGTNDAGGRDAGDGISNLNSDDIESVTFLKGPASTALYGTGASNGVILITTKKAKAGVTKIDFSSNFTFDKVSILPKFQNKYGIDSNNMSWGPAITGSDDYTKELFQTGLTSINSLTLSSAKEGWSSYISYANTSAKGIIQNNRLNKNNLDIRESSTSLGGKLVVDANINLINQKIEDKPVAGSYYWNPLVGVYRYPRGQDITKYKNNFEVYDTARNGGVQTWYKPIDTYEQNPWWLINRTSNTDTRNRIISSLTAKIKLTNTLNVQLRGSEDYISDKFEQDYMATSESDLTGLYLGTQNNGRLILEDDQQMLYYGDVLLNYNKKFKDLSVQVNLGASINDSKSDISREDSKGSDGGLIKANVFNLLNMNTIAQGTQSEIRNQTQSLFGTAQIGYKDFLFLDLTGRNDWSSALANTKSEKKGFFYPAIGLTDVISDMVTLPSFISFGKIRATYTVVGNSITPDISIKLNNIAARGIFNYNVYQAPYDLKPELSKALELGTEWRFLNNRIDFDFTFYNTNTINQLFTINAPSGSGARYYYVNAGNIQNRGIEITLGLVPVKNNNFIWRSTFNFALNKNKVIELQQDVSEFDYSEINSNSYQMKLVKGGSVGDIYGKVFTRDQNGVIQYDSASGLPLVNTPFSKIANANPKYTLGWNNTLTYKNITLGFLIDARVGGHVISMTQADLDFYGVSKESGDARDQKYVDLEGKHITDVQGFYTRVGGRAGVSEYYVYSATNVRLRELTLGYDLPKTILGKNGFIKDCSLSLVGRNLFFIVNKAPYDPDATLSTGNDLQGIDVYGMPTTRTFGFNLKLSF